MATASGEAHCAICGKQNTTFKCRGYSQEFCFNHLADHKQELRKQFDEIEMNCNLFRQSLTERTTDPITKTQQSSEETRQLVFEHTKDYIAKLEVQLNKLTDELQQSREENDFNEMDLHQFQEKLNELTKELAKISNISIQQNATSLVTEFSTHVTSDKYLDHASINQRTSIDALNIDVNARWIQNGITVAGGNGYGDRLNQLTSPFSVYTDNDQAVYVADYSNNRIVKWKSDATSGEVVAGGNGSGNRIDQLDYPTDVIVDTKTDCLIICDRGNQRIVRWSLQNRTSGETIISNIYCYGLTIDHDGYLYVSDNSKDEVKRWRIGDTDGTIVAGGNEKGNRSDQLDSPTYIYVDQNHSVYVSDSNNHRVMKWEKDAKEGIVVAGGNGRGDALTQLLYPCEVAVDQLETVYVADFSNHRVICWSKGAREGNILVGETGKGDHANQMDGPCGLSFDRQGNLYVADLSNNRVQKFNIDSNSNS